MPAEKGDGGRWGERDSSIVAEVEGERRGSREVEVEGKGEKAWGELIKTPRNAFTREREEEGGGTEEGRKKKSNTEIDGEGGRKNFFQ